MPDYNPAIATSMPPQQLNLAPTLEAASNLQLNQQRAGLLQLQQLQASREYNALQAASQAYRAGEAPDKAYLAAGGGDPQRASQFQNLQATGRAISETPGNIMPEQASQLASMREHNATTANLAETNKQLQLKTLQEKAATSSQISKSLYANPTQENYDAALADAQAGHISPPRLAQLNAAKGNPTAMKQWASDLIAQTQSMDLHNVPSGEGVTSPLTNMSQNNPAPAPGMAQGSGIPTAPLSPRALAAERAAGNKDAEYSDKLAEDAKTARSVNYTLDNISRDAENLPVGRGMAGVAEGRAWLQSVYDNVPAAKNFMSDPGKDATAAYDSLLKNSGQLTRQALMQTHERAAVAYNMIQKQLPSVDTSRGGLQHVVAEWQGMNDDSQAKQQVMSNRPVAGRSDKFEAEWNQNVNPVAFMLARLNPDDRTKVIKGLSSSPQGKQVLSDIKNTYAYIHAQQGAQ